MRVILQRHGRGQRTWRTVSAKTTNARGIGWWSTRQAATTYYRVVARGAHLARHDLGHPRRPDALSPSAPGEVGQCLPSSESIASMDAITTPPAPVNEPNLNYAPGSPERATIEAELAHLRRPARST